MMLFHIPLGKIFEYGIDRIQDYILPITRAVAFSLKGGFTELVSLMVSVNPIIFILASSAMIFFLLSRRLAFFNLIGFGVILSMNLWTAAIETLVLVIIASSLIIIIGVPLGILSALYSKFKKIIFPILDVMQTMPAYVYLIPIIPLFGLGAATALVVTIIFALPPVIRLTSLGIEQISQDFLEAADAFGSSKWQKLIKVQLPLANKAILNGINQGIMMSLSMVVLASLVGAKGLGTVVWRAIQRLDVGLGFEAGLAVVILAILLDRITKKIIIKKKVYVE